MSEGRERSAQEREAARLERERRRAGRSWSSPPREVESPLEAAPSPPREVELPVQAPPSPLREVESTVEAVKAPRQSRQSRQPRRPRRPRRKEVEHLIEAVQPRKARRKEGKPHMVPLFQARKSALGAAPATLEGGASVVQYGNHDEPPLGTRRASRLTRARASSRTAGGAAGPRSPRLRGRKHSRLGRIVALIALLLAAAVIWFLVELFQPFHGSGHGTVSVTIPPQMTSSQVGDLLERDGVIASSFFFELRATLGGERSDLHPGSYRLGLDASYGSVLSTLSTPPPAAKVTELTITEGHTRRQISALLHGQGVRGGYFTLTHSSSLLDPRRYGAPAGVNSLEGFLFPSTYQLREPISMTALIADQLQAFKQRFATVSLDYARSRRLSAYDVLIVASMVEAESPNAHDRPLVASVIYNRLRDGMPLQIDATTRYGTGNYTRPLTVSELNSPSAYNTRIHKGLPPTPIDNPGLASIQAAAHPPSTNYLYFVVKPCGNGAQLFTSSYTQFLADSRRYQSARSRRGGQSPARCH
ncbi:MAG: endolytic transglycosylase MltG [Solirubrobacteraceae bacterium]